MSRTPSSYQFGLVSETAKTGQESDAFPKHVLVHTVFGTLSTHPSHFESLNQMKELDEVPTGYRTRCLAPAMSGE